MSQPVSQIPNPPKSKYELFQKISFVQSCKKDNTIVDGVITGIEYVSPVVAISEGTDYGWLYVVRCKSGIEDPIEDYVGCDFYAYTLGEGEIVSR
ncbi:MAG: hypothetical protein AAFY20_09410 [Cyanobacteria bacterium J06639_14]